MLGDGISGSLTTFVYIVAGLHLLAVGYWIVKAVQAPNHYASKTKTR